MMKERNRLLTVVALGVLLYMITPLAAWAQQFTFKGNVTDEGGEPLIGVSVVMKGRAKVATITDLDGNYVLQAPESNLTLVLTYVGMKQQEVRATAGQALHVTMKADAQTLDETVVVGYGQQKKVSVVGSITQTSGKVLERTGGVSNIGAALTGNLPGVVTMSSTGMPGDEDPQIVIRGISTWTVTIRL
jgi:outer membrane receptor for Fe3+-dicitrate